MNWKIRPPRQFAPLGPQDWPRASPPCNLSDLKGRIFQFIPTQCFFPEQECIGNYPSNSRGVKTVCKFNTLPLYKKECPRLCSAKEFRRKISSTSVFLATNKKGKKQPLTKMMPRVKCSLCEFTGKEGKKMMDHMKKEHEVDFNC